MPGHDHPGLGFAFETRHRCQPSLEPFVVTLDRVVGVALNVMARTWEHVLDRPHMACAARSLHLLAN
jgi:hypothetical protein